MHQRIVEMVDHWIIRVPEAEGPLRLQAWCLLWGLGPSLGSKRGMVVL